MAKRIILLIGLLLILVMNLPSIATNKTVKVKSTETKIKESYEEYILQDDSLIPKGTKVFKVILLDGDLLVNFSSEFLNYGGTLWEEMLAIEILEHAFFFDEVSSVTVYIEGKPQIWVEGTQINRYTRDKWRIERNIVDE